eukprot:s2333_g8.t1
MASTADMRHLVLSSTPRKVGDNDLESSSDDLAMVELEETNARVRLLQSAYDAGLLAMAQSSDDNYVATFGSNQACGRLVNGLGLFLIAAFLQGVLVALIILFSNERMQDPYEHYRSAHMAQLLRQAMATNSSLPDSDPVSKLCLSDHSVPWSQSMLVFLWLCRSSPPIFTSLWSLYLIAYMPRPKGHCVVSGASNADIVALPLKTKLWMVFAIKIPTIIIEIALLIAGMKFLMYCNALGPLIMKALGMAYIKTIPDIVFGGLSSKPFQAEVDKTSLVAQVPFLPAWDTWVSGAAKIVLHVSLALWYCRVYHGALQDFRMACFQYKYQFVFPTCHCGLSFFGMRLAN